MLCAGGGGGEDGRGSPSLMGSCQPLFLKVVLSPNKKYDP